MVKDLAYRLGNVNFESTAELITLYFVKFFTAYTFPRESGLADWKLLPLTNNYIRQITHEKKQRGYFRVG